MKQAKRTMRIKTMFIALSVLIILTMFMGGCLVAPTETKYQSSTVYPSHQCLNSNCTLEPNGTVKRGIEINEHNRLYRAEELKNDNELQSKNWSEEVKQAIINSDIALGMTEEQIIFSWGMPKRTSRSVGSWGVHKQWTYETSFKHRRYSDTYLHIENGILVSYSN